MYMYYKTCIELISRTHDSEVRYMPPKGFLYVSKLATHINNITISCQWVMGSQLLVLFDWISKSAWGCFIFIVQ